MAALVPRGAPTPPVRVDGDQARRPSLGGGAPSLWPSPSAAPHPAPRPAQIAEPCGSAELRLRTGRILSPAASLGGVRV